MRSPARLVTGTAAAALTAVALGLATTPSAYAEGAVTRPESHAWPASLTSPGTRPATGAAAETDPKPGTDTEPAESELFGTALTETEPTETGLTEEELPEAELDAEAELSEPELSEAELSDLEPEPGAEEELSEAKLGAGTRPGASPRPEPVKPPPGTRPPGTKPEPVKPPAPPTGTWPERPSGHVGTGVGGSAGPGTAQLATGAGILGAAAVGGAWLLRRRRTDGAQDG
ncbi:hypothetical protein EES45_24050 [Streptomyces sp. ADI97-07]|uniref:hypothetical protein n=1 Tax=Streptomyces sp. ADI97-07 TaxID=1522762 RepID=UPI000F559AF7|nr:hypothetical protein [Streptomyces sp. ADI97-07]RPK75969.1 hypothetical protein EES45_24050 [Streptomyces sp. ADI97-07]